MELKKATRQRIVSVARFRFAGDLPSEILQPFSEAATRVVPNKNLLKIFAIFSGKQQWKSFYFNNVVDFQVCNFF